MSNYKSSYIDPKFLKNRAKEYAGYTPNYDYKKHIFYAVAKRIEELEKQLANSVPKSDYNNLRALAMHLMGNSNKVELTRYGVKELFKRLDGTQISIKCGGGKLSLELLKN